jgi:hypothetical protein
LFQSHIRATRSVDIYLSKACAKSERGKKVPYFIEEKYIAGITELTKSKAAGVEGVSFFYSLSKDHGNNEYP